MTSHGLLNDAEVPYTAAACGHSWRMLVGGMLSETYKTLPTSPAARAETLQQMGRVAGAFGGLLGLHLNGPRPFVDDVITALANGGSALGANDAKEFNHGYRDGATNYANGTEPVTLREAI